ncbi:DUF1206 domain-containing protein (plasmid) [Rhizobium sp. TH2]|uniref:DUF1206 domain-containing protein n=1 Tax=Rhizobium sp. TH2 TaxID=2775403 RepID=UPI00215782A0|nr:DUF1206 domain-containing protein [Rhizobium sp. TH2]UVC12441.1 DUF1206 domain-containing protein [Rhizobium sp. TH2]
MNTSAFQLIARAGYCARAAVFFAVGGLALVSGLSRGTSDTKSALGAIPQQPFGRIWVGFIALGLMGFVGWRLAQSLGNADRHPPKAKGFAIRAALFGSALAYVGLAWFAAERALGLAGENDGGAEKGLAAWAMSQPFGKYLAAVIGLGFIIGGIVTIAKGVLRKYEQYIDQEAKANRLTTWICVYGLSARGLLFVIVGCFFSYAAFKVAPEQAGSVVDALNWIRNLPFGALLYSVVALGLASFGAFNVVQARYRLVREPRVPQEIAVAAKKSADLVSHG